MTGHHLLAAALVAAVGAYALYQWKGIDLRTEAGWHQLGDLVTGKPCCAGCAAGQGCGGDTVASAVTRAAADHASELAWGAATEASIAESLSSTSASGGAACDWGACS